MASVLDRKPDPSAKFESRVEQQIAEATGRIRFHDLAAGALAVGALVLAYAAVMILLDRYLVLPQAARQAALGGFLLAAGAVTYFLVVRPATRRVNPLYAAVQVEKTITDNQNSVAGYVDLKGRDVPPAIRAAIAARAAKSLGGADLNRAVDHRGLVYLGVAAIALAVTLVVLFFVFRPAQFLSLAKRAFAPFTAEAIRTRTELELVRPEAGDLTVTSGQPVTIAVRVKGRLPDPEGPDRVRLQLRHNPADPAYDEVPLDRGEDSRSWDKRVPNHLVQNGFWYRVAAGDFVTPEYRVTVRSQPMFEGYEAAYEPPAYLRMTPWAATSPALDAYRGTKVVLTARTNRPVADGRMEVTWNDGKDAGAVVVPGEKLPDRPDTLRFRVTIQDAGSYKLSFTSAEGERSVEMATPFPIVVTSDQPPSVEITKPDAEETVQPANGQLAVDGTVGDDHGIGTVKLVLKEPGDKGRKFEFPYLNGKEPTFRRDPDGSYPTALAYKGSVDFTKLTDAAGLPVAVKEGDVLEYWLEAADNCDVPPGPNVGRSKVQKVKLTAPATAGDDFNNAQKEQNEQKDRRQKEEKQHREQQKEQLQQEKRDPQPNPQQKGDPQQGDNPQQGEQPQPQNNPGPKDQQQPKKGEQPKGDNARPQAGDNNPPKGDNPQQQPPKPGPNDPTPKEGDQPQQPMDSNGGEPNKGDPKAGDGSQPPNKGGPDPKDRETQQQADKVNDALNQEQKNGGEGKPNTTPEPGDQKPADPQHKPAPKEQSGNAAEQKGGSPDNAGGQPNPSETKPQGAPKPQPPQPSEQKPGAEEPKAGNPMQNPAGGNQPENGSENKPPPQPNQGGQDRPPPKNAGGNDQQPMPNDAQKPDDDKQPGGSGKNAGPQPPKAGGTDTQPGGDPKDDPSKGAGQSKPMSKPDGKPGQSREPNPQRDPMNNGGDPAGGTAKPERDPDAGADQPTRKPAGGQSGKPDAEQKPAPSNDPNGTDGNPAETKPDTQANNGQPGSQDPKTPPKGNAGDPQAKRPPRGTDRPTPGGPKDKTDARNGGQQQGSKGPEGSPMPRQKLDPKDVADAAKDLNNPDPQKQQAARDKLDNMIGKENREAAEQMAKDLQSPDKATREAAEKKLDQMRKQAEQQARDKAQANNGQPMGNDPTNGPKDQADARNGSQGKPPGKEGSPMPREKLDPKEVAEAAKDLNSPDPQKQQAARDKLDKMMGKENREAAEKMAKDLQSPDKATREAAEKKLDQMRQKAEQEARDQANNGGNPKPMGNEPSQPKPGEPMGDQAQAGGPKGKDDAKAGPAGEPKKGTEPAAGDPNPQKEPGGSAGGDPKPKDGKPGGPKDQSDPSAQKGPGEKKLFPEEMKKLAEQAGKLASKDDAERQAAEKEFDKAVGKENREAIQKMAKDLKSDDAGTREAAQKKLEQMAKEAEEQARKDGRGDPKDGNPKGQPLSKDEQEKLAGKLKDLNSDDQAKKEAAEKEFDQKLGKENRQALQKAMEDAAKQPMGDPKQGEQEAKKQLDQMAQNPPGKGKNNDDLKSGPGGGDVPLNKPMDDDPKNRLRSAELQLEQFKKHEHNKNLHEKLGMTEGEYQRFVKGYEDMVNRMKADADQPVDRPAPKASPAAPSLTVGDGGMVAPRAGGSQGTGASVGGPVYAPPGFGDAQKKFAEQAGKVQPKK